MQRVLGVGLNPVTGWALQLRWCRDHATHPGRAQRPVQPEPRRAGLVGHGDRAVQSPEPCGDLLVRRRQPRLAQFAGLAVDRGCHDRSGVHVQTHTRTLCLHRGLPTQCRIGRAGHSCQATHEYARERPRPATPNRAAAVRADLALPRCRHLACRAGGVQVQPPQPASVAGEQERPGHRQAVGHHQRRGRNPPPPSTRRTQRVTSYRLASRPAHQLAGQARAAEWRPAESPVRSR
jgi:hypothetical protein